MSLSRQFQRTAPTEKKTIDDARRVVVHPPFVPVIEKPVAKPSLPKADAPSKMGSTTRSDRKTRTTLWLDNAVVEFFQKDGPGWQTRMNEVLRKAIE